MDSIPVARSTKQRRSSCPVAASSDIFGDRWTLLVVRDLLGGPRRFKDLVAAAEGIPTNVLSARLARLLEQGVLVHVEAPGGSKHLAYRLTGKGAALHLVIAAISDWAATGSSRKGNVPPVRHRPLDYTP